ncbi:hypothetical protein [Devosia sp. CAU 1758]
MTKNYFLVDPWNRTDSEKIDTEEAEKLLSARDFISDYISFEENLVAVKNSFYEYELFLLSIGLDYEFDHSADSDFFQDKRVLANAKVLSVLNSITSFRDRFPNIKYRHNDTSTKEYFKENWDTQKSGSIEFHFCEVLRNYAQHNTQPISGVTVGGGWDDKREWRESRASIFVTVSEVTADRKVPNHLKEKFVNHFGTKADVTMLLREAVDGLGLVAKEMRSWLGPELERVISHYQGYLDRAERDGFLYLVLTSDSDYPTGQPQFFSDFLTRARKLRARTILTHTSNHYISSRPRGHSAP